MTSHIPKDFMWVDKLAYLLVFSLSGCTLLCIIKRITFRKRNVICTNAERERDLHICAEHALEREGYEYREENEEAQS
mgnify:CR=1 FL=1